MFVYHPALWAPLLPGGGELKLLSSFDTFFTCISDGLRSRKCESSQSCAFEFLFFQLFSFVPDGVHLFQSHIMQVFAFLDSMCFQIIKAVDKLLVGAL